MPPRIKAFMRLMPLLAFFGLGGCEKKADAPPTTADLVGRYEGRYGGGDETIELKADGNFEQVFKVGNATTYTSSGKWRFHDGDIVFESFKVPATLHGNDTTATVASLRANWERNPIRIELGEWPYFVRK